ncbi:MAG: ABC transporter ATP-binding protein/permease [candidate division Zixibacteria bacterium]|nr:ABC transporter ATP-binding protein/permease [candidate division Zixibacteria bacterium]
MNLYRRTFSVLVPFWKQLSVASLSAALHALLSGLLIWMVGPLLNTLFQVNSPLSPTIIPGQGSPQPLQQLNTGFDSIKESMKGWIDQLAAGSSRQDTLINFCILILAVVLLKNLFLYLQGFYMAYVQQAVVRHFRNTLFDKYLRLSLDYFQSRRTGHVMSRVTNDVVVLNESIDLGFNRLITDSLFTIMLFGFLLILSWKLTLLAMIVLPVIFGFIWFIGRKLRKYSERSQERMADVTSVLEESVNNARIVKAFSMETFERSKFFKATQNYFKALLRMTRIRHLASPINDTLATVAGVIILLFAGSQIVAGSGELSAADFMTYILAMFSLIKPVKDLSQIHIKLQEGMAAAERVFEVIDTPEKIIERPNAATLDSFTSVIRYESVSFSYNPGEPVLQDISFEVRRGEIVAVVGPSGAGKSTLFDLLPRFYDPLLGRVTIDGHDLRDLSLASLRGLLGIVTQETILFNDSIQNNIAYGMNGVAPEKVIDAARAANAHDFITQFEHGYQTQVGNRGVMLSGGQRQRIAIARALLKDPQILIFDEATSSLDTESEMLVQQAIDRLMANRTTLVIAHRLSTIKNADRILVLENGRIVEGGTHEQLLANGRTYSRLYEMQFRGDA